MENSSFGRLIGVLVSPGKTFLSIAERPTWVVALLVLAVLGMGVGLLVNERLDQRELIRKQMETFGQEPTEEQLEEAVERAENPSPLLRAVSAVAGLAGHALVYLFLAFLFWLVFKMLGSEMPFKASFSTYLHASIPVGISFLLSIPVVLSRSSLEPGEAFGGLLASGPAAFVPEETRVLVKAALGGLDFFALWALVLTVIGYRTVARVSTATAAAVAILFWLVGIGFRVGWAALLS
ncbi:MAG TPA: YIP1 family protein [Thermoanaerobaculia bacterium]|jgi:hypothetical protein